MTTALILIISAICLLVGLVGSIVPALPGPPFSWVGLLLLYLTDSTIISSKQLAVLTVIVVVVQVLDYLLPAWLTKRFGGSKLGVVGSIVGMIVGLLFFGPLGIILGPFIGAVAGELINGSNSSEALKSGFGSFLGFVFTSGAKIAIGLAFIWIYIQSVFLQ